jgi:hypothetical protein
MLDLILDPVGYMLVERYRQAAQLTVSTYPVLRKLVPQVLSRLLDSGLMTKLLFFTNIVKRKSSYVNHSVNLGE